MSILGLGVQSKQGLRSVHEPEGKSAPSCQVWCRPRVAAGKRRDFAHRCRNWVSLSASPFTPVMVPRPGLASNHASVYAPTSSPRGGGGCARAGLGLAFHGSEGVKDAQSGGSSWCSEGAIGAKRTALGPGPWGRGGDSPD